jgi:hypothetical protein
VFVDYANNRNDGRKFMMKEALAYVPDDAK